jgi:hypothetical protein
MIKSKWMMMVPTHSSLSSWTTLEWFCEGYKNVDSFFTSIPPWNGSVKVTKMLTLSSQVCQAKLGLACLATYYQNNNLLNRKFRESMNKVNIYNVQDGEDCAAVDAIVNSDNYSYDSYTSPASDGSPYVHIFGNCVDLSCSAVYSSKYLDEMVATSRLNWNTVGGGCGLVLMGAVVSAALAHRPRSRQQLETKIELLPTTNSSSSSSSSTSEESRAHVV